MSSFLLEKWELISAWNKEGGHAALWLTLIFLIAGALIASGPRWRKVRVGVTFFHELGHALAGLIVGARITKIVLNVNTSGVTHWEFPGTPGRIRTAWVAWWGYPAPSLIGSLGMLALFEGWGRIYAAAIMATVMLVLLFWVRNIWGVAICFGAAIAGFLVVWQGAIAGEILAALTSGFSIVGGIRTVLEHFKEKVAPGNDSSVVAQKVFIPAKIVKVTMLIAAVLTPLVTLIVVLL